MCLQVLGLLGGLVSGIGSAMGAAQQAAAYRAQAQLHERQAAAEREKGSYDARRVTDKAKAVVGMQIANYSANGLQIDGSPADVIVSSAKDAALDVAAVRYGAAIREGNEKYQAKIERMNASSASAAVPFALLSPVIGSAT